MYEHDFCEYAVRKKAEGKYLAARCAAAALILLFAAVFFFLSLIPMLGLLWSAAILAAAGVLIWYLSRFTLIEYEYTLTGAIFDAAAVYNRQYRKEKLSVDLKKIRALRALQRRADRRRVCAEKKSSTCAPRQAPRAPTRWSTKPKKGCEAVLFDASARMIECIRRVIPSVTTVSDGLPEL